MIPIQEWINARIELLGEKTEDSGIAQACRFRNSAHTLATSFEEYKNCAYVVGEHTSKSKRLPVVRYSANSFEGFPYVYKRKRYRLNPKFFSLMVGSWEDAYVVMRVIGSLQREATK